jgi:transposase
MVKKYIVKLTKDEKQQLKSMLSSGKHAAKKVLKARVLLKANQGWLDARIAAAFDLNVRTVERMRQQFVEEGFEAFIAGRYKKRCYPRKIDGKAEAHLIATACSQPPEGHTQWTLQLLGDRLVQLKCVESISRETVRQALKKTN